MSLAPGKTTTFKANPVETEYDSYRDSSSRGGWEYYGWMLIDQNNDQSIHSIATSIGNLKTNVEKNPEIGELFLKLTTNQLVERNLTKRR